MDKTLIRQLIVDIATNSPKREIEQLLNKICSSKMNEQINLPSITSQPIPYESFDSQLDESYNDYINTIESSHHFQLDENGEVDITQYLAKL